MRRWLLVVLAAGVAGGVVLWYRRSQVPALAPMPTVPVVPVVRPTVVEIGDLEEAPAEPSIEAEAAPDAPAAEADVPEPAKKAAVKKAAAKKAPAKKAVAKKAAAKKKAPPPA